MDNLPLQANLDQLFLRRAAQLALQADANVLDSPRVGSVLAHQGRIIGEGYHRRAGFAHAEVNCLASVREVDRGLISKSTLYVSLEPCCIVGKTGACSTLILKHKIKTVVIAQRDSTPGVDGDSVKLLREAGVEVREYPDFSATEPAYRYRHTLVTTGRPHVTLKFAKSADGLLRPADQTQPYWITNAISKRLVHKWRAETTAIMVGARTVLDDDPFLTTRLYPGPDPVPVIIDPKGIVTGKENVFRGPIPALLFTSAQTELLNGDSFVIAPDLTKSTLVTILETLASRRLANITVEGGAALLTAFLSNGLWNEARVFTGPNTFGNGLPAPEPISFGGRLLKSERIGSDLLEWLQISDHRFVISDS